MKQGTQARPQTAATRLIASRIAKDVRATQQSPQPHPKAQTPSFRDGLAGTGVMVLLSGYWAGEGGDGRKQKVQQGGDERNICHPCKKIEIEAGGLAREEA